jgi:diguanylate cyclase (GGDEF)-like protein/PAS domain S-box-containing protein
MYKTISWDYRNIVWKKVSSMWWKLYHTDDFWKNMWKTILSGNIWKWEIENPKINEKLESYITSTTITPVKNKNGEIIEFIAIKYDITKSEKNKKELSKANKEFHNIINSTSQWFWIINKKLVLQDINESFCIMLWYEKHELIGKCIRDLLDEKNKKILDIQVKDIEETNHREYHIEFTKKDRTTLPVVLKATSLYDENGSFKKAVAFITDITQIKAYEKKLYEISIKDSLTWIWNRRYFDEKLQQYFNEILSENTDTKTLCVWLIDIDFFKNINDTLGHDVWDIVLKELWKRFLHISKKNIEVFRTGWEEFWIIATNISENDFYEIINNFRIYNEKTHIEYENWIVKFTISGWIRYFDITKKDKIPNPKALYKKTDVSLYAAKHSGRNNIKTSDDI